MFKICSAIENIRRKGQMRYKMLKGLILFANTKKVAGKELSDLLIHSKTAVLTEASVNYLCTNYGRVFAEESADDVGYSRCRPANERRKEQLENRANIAIESV